MRKPTLYWFPYHDGLGTLARLSSWDYLARLDRIIHHKDHRDILTRLTCFRPVKRPWLVAFAHEQCPSLPPILQRWVRWRFLREYPECKSYLMLDRFTLDLEEYKPLFLQEDT